MAWAGGGEQQGWGTAAADGMSICLLFQSSRTRRLLLAITTQAAVMRVFSGSRRKANTCKQNSTPIEKYSCTNQIKVLTDPLWENWSHGCVCKLFGEKIVSHFLAAKYNIAAANNNTQRVFNGTHVHFKHESVFTTPLEDKGKVETEKLVSSWWPPKQPAVRMKELKADIAAEHPCYLVQWVEWGEGPPNNYTTTACHTSSSIKQEKSPPTPVLEIWWISACHIILNSTLFKITASLEGACLFNHLVSSTFI